jgi:uncharacterized membrane protein YtjA (UPF0391 family)
MLAEARCASAAIAFLSYGGTRAATIGRAAGLFLSSVTRWAHSLPTKEFSMLKYAIIFAVISLVAALLGFGGVAAGAAGIAKLLFGLFLVLAVLFVVLAALGVGAVKKAID